MTLPAPQPTHGLALGLNAVILAVTQEQPRVLAQTSGAAAEANARDARVETLPFGPLDPRHATLELGMRAWVRAQTGHELGYVEQLYTFADRHRDPVELAGGPRVVSVAYLALVRESLAGAGRWRNVYDFLPWEDGRDGAAAGARRALGASLERWARGAPERGLRTRRRERAEICFGLHGVAWDPERVLERYELLYEAGLAAEACRAPGAPVPAGAAPAFGEAMALDHRRILATAVGRLRGKVRYRPVVFELLPPEFTLLQLLRTVEALAGTRLHKQNFRRLVEQGGLVEGTGERDSSASGRPAERFRFRREVLRERPAPGVGLPGARRG